MKKQEEAAIPLYSSPAAVGRLIGVSKMTILREIERGAITPIRTPGGHYRIERKEAYRYRASLMGLVI